MIYVYVFVLFMALLLSFKEKRQRKIMALEVKPLWVSRYLFFYFIVLLFLSTFRPSALPDYEEYVRIFTEDNLNEVRYEIGDVIVIKFLRMFFSNPRCFFLFFGAVGIGMKLYAIYKYSPNVFLSTAIYLASFFVLLDMIQVRNSIAMSFFLFAVIHKCRGDWKKYLLFSFLAVSFHYSAVVVFLLAFIGNSKHLKYYAWIIPISYILVLSGKTIGFVLGGISGGVYEALFLANNSEGDINLFNSVNLMRIAFFYLIYLGYEQIEAKYPYIIVMLKIYAVSIALYVILSDVPSIAARLSHFLASVEILLLPSLLFIRSPQKLFYQTLIYAYCIGSLIIFIYSEDNKL